MKKIQVAHVLIQGLSVAVFDANARENTDDARAQLLADLSAEARRAGLRVEKAALAYGGRFYGDADLVRYLARNGRPRWTHTLSLG